MAATKIIGGATLAAAGERMNVFFGNGMSGYHWHVAMLEDGFGSEPAKATIIIPSSAPAVVDEVANLVALQPTGPMKDIKHDTPCIIRKSDGEPLFAGRVVSIKHVRDESTDGLVIEAMDAREKLRSVRVVGRAVYNPDYDTTHYQQGWPAHFNPGGRANCLINDGNPWFAPHPDFGLADGENPKLSTASEASNSGKATYWTLGHILLYLRNILGPAGPISAIQGDTAFFQWLPKCPSDIIWPTSFGTELDNEFVANFNQGVGQNNSAIGSARKGRDINLTGMYLCGGPAGPGVFDLLFSTAGGFSWDLQTSGESDGGISNTLKAVSSRYSSGSGVDIPYAAGGNADDITTAVITAVNYAESSEDTITRAVGSGALVKIEMRCSTKSTDHGGTAALLRAWTDDRFDAFREFWATQGNNEAGYQKTIRAYPEVLTVFQLNPESNFQDQTPPTVFEDYPRAKITRPIWPFLLSFQGDTDGPKDSNIKPFPIHVEIAKTNESTWYTTIEYSGLEVWDNGIIYMPMLRDIVLLADSTRQGSWYANNGTPKTPAVSGGKVQITVNDIRMTIAIRCDHRLTKALKTSSDTADNGSGFDFSALVGDSPDLDRFEKGFARAKFMDLGSLYELWGRINSYPTPEKAGGTKATDKTMLSAGTSLRDDRDVLESHVRRDLKEEFRLSRAGELIIGGYFMNSYKPGYMIDQLTPVGNASAEPFAIRGVVKGRRFISKKDQDKQGNPTIKNYTHIIIR